MGGARVLTRGATWRRAGGGIFYFCSGRTGYGYRSPKCGPRRVNLPIKIYGLRAGGDKCSRVRAGGEFFWGAVQARQKLWIDVFIRHM